MFLRCNKRKKVFDVDQNRLVQKYLFAVEYGRSCQDIDAIPVKLSGMVLSNPRDMDVLLDCDFAVAEKNRLYRCLDHIMAHKDALCEHLKTKWETMFDLEYDILLYDLTSTYFEGMCQGIPKAKFGHSKDRRSDCRQILIGLEKLQKNYRNRDRPCRSRLHPKYTATNTKSNHPL